MSQDEIQQLQLMQQGLQQMASQKQEFQRALLETESALEEIKRTDKNPYKIIGNIMVESDKDKLKKELEEKKDMLDSRINSLEKEEEKIRKKAEKIQNKIMKEINKKNEEK